ncbi:leucine-rich repeat-containing protein 74A [Patella vulgata]|uniref:leucine-rich repeat-containing protein 74A n=1 Tax=Patella vulgata TaxID=6465 RepID=UPI00217F5B70|nr:leucine-rich repeat-containing protein 74A [Patella vulgata]
MLKMNETLGELMLNYCNIDEEAGVLLGSALAKNIGLKWLDLSWNGIRKRGAVKFCQGLAVNECLEYLDLSWNGLDREGCMALESCLKRNTVLKELDLTCNRIDYVGLKPVVNGLVKNYTLRVLKLSFNPLTTTGAVAILRAIMLSPRCSIKEIHLADIPVDKDFMKCLAELYDVRSIKVIHGENLHQTHQGTEKPKAALEHYDPCMVLFEYMKQENLRLIDLFRVLDTDQSGTLSRKELCQAFLAMNLPLSVASLELLMQRLDSDDNNQIDIEEMKKGQKKTFRKAQAMRRNSEVAYDAILEDIKKHVKRAIDEKRRTKPNESHDIISRIEKALKT